MDDENNRELSLDIRVGKSADQRILDDELLCVSVTEIADVQSFTDQLTSEFVDGLMSEFTFGSDHQRKLLRVQFRQQAGVYLARKSRESRKLSNSGGKELLEELEQPFRLILDNLSSLSSEQAVELASYMGKLGKVDPVGTLDETRFAIERLRNAAAALVRDYKPKSGPRPFKNLELTVGTLMLAIEIATGKRADASLNNDYDYHPMSKSAEADAIIGLLMAVDPSLRKVSIIRKIEDVRSAYRGEKLKDFASLLLSPIRKQVPRRLRTPISANPLQNG